MNITLKPLIIKKVKHLNLTLVAKKTITIPIKLCEGTDGCFYLCLSDSNCLPELWPLDCFPYSLGAPSLSRLRLRKDVYQYIYTLWYDFVKQKISRMHKSDLEIRKKLRSMFKEMKNGSI